MRNSNIFIRVVPYSLRGLFGFSSSCFGQAKLYRQTFLCKHSSRREAHWQREGWRDDFEGALGAVCAGKSIPACSCGFPSPALLSFLIFQIFQPFFNNFFLCFLTGLPGFSSNRCNNDKHLRGRKRDQKMCKTSQNEPI